MIDHKRTNGKGSFEAKSEFAKNVRRSTKTFTPNSKVNTAFQVLALMSAIGAAIGTVLDKVDK